MGCNFDWTKIVFAYVDLVFLRLHFSTLLSKGTSHKRVGTKKKKGAIFCNTFSNPCIASSNPCCFLPSFSFRGNFLNGQNASPVSEKIFFNFVGSEVNMNKPNHEKDNEKLSLGAFSCVSFG